MFNFKNEADQTHIKDMAGLTEVQFDYINERVDSFVQSKLEKAKADLDEGEESLVLQVELTELAQIAARAAEEQEVEVTPEVAFILGLIVSRIQRKLGDLQRMLANPLMGLMQMMAQDHGDEE